MLAELKQNLERRSDGARQSIREEGQVLAGLREADFKEITENELPNIPVHIITSGFYRVQWRIVG